VSQPGTDLWTLGVIVGLTVVTVVTRSFFFLSSREWQLPHWAQRGLQYAPIAALSAVIVPEVVMTQGQLITTWQDARLFGAAAGRGLLLCPTRAGPGRAGHDRGGHGGLSPAAPGPGLVARRFLHSD
jgi:branched-subunit amino acid transport protein